MERTLYKVNLILFTALVVGFILAVIIPNRVFAKCEQNYGGGETCIINKRFKIEKEVRVVDESDDFEDKVTKVAEDDVVEFEITIENISDEPFEADDMKMKDILPDELEKISGDLTEEWDDFEAGEKKTFKIKARVDEDEYDRDNFDKCIVNKAEVYYDDDFEGADTATVCYGNAEVTELPETGASSTAAMAIAGFASIGLGASLKKILFA